MRTEAYPEKGSSSWTQLRSTGLTRREMRTSWHSMLGVLHPSIQIHGDHAIRARGISSEEEADIGMYRPFAPRAKCSNMILLMPWAMGVGKV